MEDTSWCFGLHSQIWRGGGEEVYVRNFSRWEMWLSGWTVFKFCVVPHWHSWMIWPKVQAASRSYAAKTKWAVISRRLVSLQAVSGRSASWQFCSGCNAHQPSQPNEEMAMTGSGVTLDVSRETSSRPCITSALSSEEQDGTRSLLSLTSIGCLSWSLCLGWSRWLYTSHSLRTRKRGVCPYTYCISCTCNYVCIVFCLQCLWFGCLFTICLSCSVMDVSDTWSERGYHRNVTSHSHTPLKTLMMAAPEAYTADVLPRGLTNRSAAQVSQVRHLRSFSVQDSFWLIGSHYCKTGNHKSLCLVHKRETASCKCMTCIEDIHGCSSTWHTRQVHVAWVDCCCTMRSRYELVW